jgi:hypothetical protein
MQQPLLSQKKKNAAAFVVVYTFVTIIGSLLIMVAASGT